MARQQDKKPPGMKGGIRRPRGPSGTWSFVIDMGLQEAQRCEACSKREWAGPERFEACPACGSAMRDTRERRQVVSGGYVTQTDAKLARALALHKLGKGSYRPPERMTLAEYLRDRWLPQVKREDLKRTTLDGYRRNVREHLIGPRSKPFTLGSIELRKLSLEAIREHYEMLGEGYPVERKGKLVDRKGLGVESRRRVHACLHRAMNDAMEVGFLDHNPAWRAARNLKAKPHELDVWTADELSTFLEATAGSSLYPIYHVLAMTGMRRGEAVGLQWGDVDLTPRSVEKRAADGTIVETVEAGRITVRRSRVPVAGGEVVESTPKTGKIRVVDLDPGTVAVLRELRDGRKVVPLDDRRSYVFTGEGGAPLGPNTVTHRFRCAVVAAGLRHIPLHGLRHTHASLAIDAGVPIPVVSKRLGHANATITMNVYAHQLRGTQSEAACVVAGLLRTGSK